MPETAILAPDADGLATAAGLLRGARLVAFPTETVYGLGGDARSDRAVAAIYAAKGRPAFNPLIAHVAGLEAAEVLAVFDDRARALAAAFWPGPLTLVLPLRSGHRLSALMTAGLASVALRVPAHGMALALLEAFGGPLAAPSANPSGRISPTSAAHVLAGLAGRVDAVIDGGACAVGVESTILDLTGPATLLRAGGLPAEALERVTGHPLLRGADKARPLAPGQLASHYAPAALLRLNAVAPAPGEIMIGFGASPGRLNLSPRADLTEAAANLFAMLHQADARAGPAGIAVAPIPDHGLGRAINDRLRRAAAPRGGA